MATVKNVIIIGGGFAGINLARQLLKSKDYEVTLIDKNNYNFFPPLLYQVATSFLNPSSISYPFRKYFRHKRIHFRMAELLKVDPAKQTCYLNDGELSYDYLVFATGAKTNFFGIENIQRNAIPMKTVDDALVMRNKLLTTLEEATVTKDPDEKKKLLNIVVAGGGPTGVEVSGMLAEMKRYIRRQDYPEIESGLGDIYIVDGGESLLGKMSLKTQEQTHRALVKLGVKIKLKTRVLDFDNDQVKLSDGEIIECKTLIWAAGVTAMTFEGIPVECYGPGKRMMTNEFNKVQGIENIYAIGDTSIQKTDTDYPEGHPQLAQVAIQQGKNLAKNLIAQSKNKPLKAFKYFDRGDMAIVGRHNAVIDLFKNKVHVSGFPALFVWLFIHLISLINYTNKIRTLFNWTVAYLTKDQSLRMIFRS